MMDKSNMTNRPPEGNMVYGQAGVWHEGFRWPVVVGKHQAT